jgi:UDPglucose 6-dehydrogenase
MNISIIGGGYVGLVSAVCFADMGHTVTCIENNPDKYTALTQQNVPFYEPMLAEKLAHVMTAKRLHIAPEIAPTIFDSSMVILAVGTPMSDAGDADLSYLFSAVDHLLTLAKTTRPTSLILTTKSTVPVGTGQRIQRMVDEAGFGDCISVASNPEFLREGSAVHDFFHPDRIIIGSASDSVFNAFKQLYKGLHKDTRPICHVSLETAELAKYASNTFLATKISFINELATLCDHVGADIKQTAKLMGMDGRIGKYFLNPSPGYGGSCFPKDTHALHHIGQQVGVDLRVVGAAISANHRQVQYCFDQLLALFGGDISQKTVTILGTSFKPDTDDIRESSSLKIIDRLLDHGARVQVTDPKALPATLSVYGDRIHGYDSAYEAATQSDAVVLMTEWNAYRSLDLVRLRDAMRTPRFVDFRLLYTHQELTDAGFQSYVLGKGSVPR